MYPKPDLLSEAYSTLHLKQLSGKMSELWDQKTWVLMVLTIKIGENWNIYPRSQIPQLQTEEFGGDGVKMPTRIPCVSHFPLLRLGPPACTAFFGQAGSGVVGL